MYIDEVDSAQNNMAAEKLTGTVPSARVTGGVGGGWTLAVICPTPLQLSVRPPQFPEKN